MLVNSVDEIIETLRAGPFLRPEQAQRLDEYARKHPEPTKLVSQLIKLGWLTLPSFYADMDKHQKSTTRDVLALLKRLKKENIAGLVVDLRRNGGGSLEEALSLTGLV